MISEVIVKLLSIHFVLIFIKSFRMHMSTDFPASLSNIELSNQMMKKIANVLTKDENKLFTVLLDSLKYNKKNTVARVVGGWVRDKLLGMSSDDIDIALDDQSGVEFANNVNAYLKTIGIDTRRIAVIQVWLKISNQSLFQYIYH